MEYCLIKLHWLILYWITEKEFLSVILHVKLHNKSEISKDISLNESSSLNELYINYITYISLKNKIHNVVYKNTSVK